MTEITKQPESQNLPTVTNDSFTRSALQEWHDKIDNSPRELLRKAMIVGFLIFGIGGVWAATAKLGGAVIADGRVIAEDRNRLIQHKEGGIIKALHVREGQRVTAGDLLMSLDDTQVRSELSASLVQRAILRIQLARRRAEVLEQETVAFPTDFHPLIASDERVVEALRSQASEFDALRRFYAAKQEILDSRIKGEEGDIVGNNEVLKAYNRQYELYVKELEDYRVLHKQGHVQRTKLFATERRVAELEARIANVALANEKSKNNIQSLRNEKKQTRLGYLKEANEGVVDLQKALNDLQGKITRLEDMAARLEIRSPSDGTVFRIAKRTLGAVVSPGESLMEIFPDEDSLKVEAFVQLRDADQVSIGQEVEVVFPSSKSRRSQVPYPGKLVYFSADAVVSESNPQGSYVAHIVMDPDQLEVEMMPGNVAQVYIKTEPKTLLQIMAKPVTQFGFKAFKG